MIYFSTIIAGSKRKMAHIIRMIIEIVNATDKIKGIIYPKKVTGLIKITSYYTYHIIHLKLVS